MITALSIKIPEKKKGFRGWADKLRRDRVEIEDNAARGVTLRRITYTSYSGELRLEKIDPFVGVQRGRLLCSDKLIFPRQSGYRRFSSSAFSSRLCTNFALSVLQCCKNAAGLRAAIYDPAAYCADFLLSVLAYCSDVTVVTSCFEPYLCVAERALSETGAAAMVTKNRGELIDRDLVIAPQPIAEELELSENTLLLTVGHPPKNAACKAYYSYRFKMPNGFVSLKPAELSEEYFCSALYTLGSQYALGSVVPQSAVGVKGEHTAKSLANFLDNRG